MKSQDQLYDELLVLRCQQHDASAFDELVGRWQQRLWRYAYQLTGREDLAWDVVQETWLAVVKGIFRLEDAAAFPHWIYRILNNRCADLTRKTVRRRQMQQSVAESASSHCADRETQGTGELESALGQLSPEQRGLLALRFGEGLGLREIAGILSIPEGTVKSRLYHAKQQLKEFLNHERVRNG